MHLPRGIKPLPVQAMSHARQMHQVRGWPLPRQSLGGLVCVPPPPPPPRQVKKLHGDSDAYKIAVRELQTALDTLTKSRDMAVVESEYVDTVRRMAVVQVRRAVMAQMAG
jgi:hypothetical protein